ncbi:hypothetical protein EPD60_00620 [Flaviaesturariibacter flavus]|uniref:Outer membrane protein beta-barrel domain-containing protein n=1 Tax=Flaviaesturariibacter flavus TaxID=2502780 RepID=A0A4R1BQ55_9BACT|nr:hypothetical protein [Flaviaesturariibacter flavus]TCJ19658.1 hypothetical protein EPD60_00620 [Flaviaesturariibacter flavus]
MRKLLQTLLFSGFICCAARADAQDARLYKNAYGGRFEFGYDSWVGVSWKHLYTAHHGTELSVLFGTLTTVLNAEYQFNGRFKGVHSLQWVAGVGGALALYKVYDNPNDVFIRPILGIETKVKGTALDLGLEWRPMFNVSGNATNTAYRFSIPVRLAF